MTPLNMTASTLVTALGQGEAATLAALRAGKTGLTPCDFQDTPRVGHIGRVQGLEGWRLPEETAAFQCRNNALADMALRDEAFWRATQDLRRRHGDHRIATVIGTSTSGILAAEHAYRHRTADNGALPPSFSYQNTYDLYSISRFVRRTLGFRGPALTISTACASSARAFIDAHDLIASGLADAALVGGTDSLCRLTLHGFGALELISPAPCRPCDAARSGISIGEAAGFALLERQKLHQDDIALLGFGASSDGYHISSPRPDGEGAARAMRAALDSAGLVASDIDSINLHGTGTRANDAMEDAAIALVFGDKTPCASTKGFTGHTMGSCGIVEAILTKICLQTGLLVRCLGVDRVDPDFRMNVLTANQDRKLRYALSNAFGFGGINCSLVFGAA